MLQRSVLAVFLFGCCFFFCALGWSQSRIDVFGGYSYSPNSFAFLGGGENGWNAGLDFKVLRWVAVTGDVGQFYGTYGSRPSENWTTTTFMAGPRVFLPLPEADRITPFGHFLLGGVRETFEGGSAFQNPSFAWMLGGGLDYRLTRHFSLRAEGDYLHTQIKTIDNQLQNQMHNSHPKLSVGAVYRF